MMKPLTLLTAALIGTAFAQSAPTPLGTPVPVPQSQPQNVQPAARAEPVRLPEDGALSVRAGLVTPLGGIGLREAIGGLATAGGYTVVAPGLPNLTLTGLNIAPNVPVARTISFLLNTYAPGLAAALLEEQRILLIAAPETVQRATGRTAQGGVSAVTSRLGVDTVNALTVTGLLRATALPLEGGVWLLVGSAQDRTDSAALLARIEAELPRAVSAEGAPVTTELVGLRTAEGAAELAEALSEATGAVVRAVGATLVTRGTAEQRALVRSVVSSQPVPEPEPQPVTAPVAAPAVRVLIPSRAVAADVALLTALLPEGTTVTAVEGQGVAVAGSESAVIQARDLVAASAAERERAGVSTAGPVREAYPSNDPTGDAAYLRALLPDVEVVVLPNDSRLVVVGTAAQHRRAQELLLTRPGNVGGTTEFYPLMDAGGQGEIIAGAIRREVGATTTLYGNLLAVRGSAQQQERAAALIRTFQGSLTTPRADAEEIVMRSVRLSYANPETVLEALRELGAVVQASGGGGGAAPAAPGAASGAAPSASAGGLAATVDLRSGAVLLRGRLSEVETAAQAIAFLDTREVTIRVRVRVEQMSDNALETLGMTWNAAAGPVSVSAGGSGLTTGVSNRFTLPTLSATLNALSSQGQTTTILDTNFVSMSGQETVFRNGGRLVIPGTVVGTPPNTTTVGGGEFNYGLVLTFTPRLRADGTIGVGLDTEIGQQPVLGAGGSVLTSEQRLTTLADLRPGEVVVLGGALTTTQGRTNSGVPVLSRLPVVGGLFRTTNTTARRENLVFIITAEVVDPRPAGGAIQGGERVTVSPTATPVPSTVSTVNTSPAPVQTPVSAPVPAQPAAPAAAPVQPAPAPAAPAEPRNTGTERTPIGGGRP